MTDATQVPALPVRDMAIYGLIRSDLPSLKGEGGKIGAHTLHAGNQILKYADHPDVKDYIRLGNEQGADFFNTCITLSVTGVQLASLVASAKRVGFVADIVMDPSYPFFVDAEVASLISPDKATLTPVRGPNGTVLMTRPEPTCGWILGDRNDVLLRFLVDKFDLHP